MVTIVESSGISFLRLKGVLFRMKHFTTRILSLVLVLALCLGLVGMVSATGFSSYPDAGKVTYTESMDVLTNLGIIAGANGYLNPGEPVTREQAAKMIAYICIGTAAAEKLSTSKSVFEDVAAGRWSAGFINYCVEKGIIAGVGDTNRNGKAEFQPTANVTANQFVKMLLGAVGYGVNKELEGASWAANTKSFGNQVGAFEGTKAANYDAAATREEAMLYAFNVMTKAMTVSYSASSKSYYSGSSASAAIAPADEYRYTLGYKVYGLYKESNDTDDFGRPYYQWRISGSKTVSDEYYTAAAKTYTTAVTSGTLYTDLTSTYAGKAVYILNGEEQSKFLIEKNGTDTIGGNGVLTLAYTDASDKSVKLVSIVTYLGCIEEVDGKNSSVVVYYGPGDSESITYSASDYPSLKKDAYVVVAVADGKVKNMKAATTVDGVLDTSAATYLKVGSTTYNKSAAFGGLESAAADDDFTSTYTFFLDPYGYVLGDTLSGSTSTYGGYIYVTASEYTSTLLKKQANIAVQYPNGKTDVLTLNTWKNGESYYYANPTGGSTKITASNGSALNDLAVPGFYRYTTEDGLVTLKSISSSSQYAAGWIDMPIEIKTDSKALYMDGTASLKTAAFGSSVPKLYLTSTSVLKIVNANGEVTTLTGYSKIAGYTSDNSADVLILYTDGDVDTIYIFDDDYITTSTGYAFYTGDSYTKKGVDYYIFYANGKEADYAIDSSSLVKKLTDDSLYTLTLTDGVVTGLTLEMPYKNAVTVTKTATRSFTADDTTYSYADDYAIFNATTGSKDTLSKGDIILFAQDNDDNVTCIYIVG